MNVNTNDATPLHEEILNPTQDRVFHDGGEYFPLWFEVTPDRFTCEDYGGTWQDVEDFHADFPETGLTLAVLVKAYPKLRDVTVNFPRN